MKDKLNRCAQLRAIPSTLIVPLAARAGGAAYFPWLACDDADAARLFAGLGLDLQDHLNDRPTLLSILWRTAVLKDAGKAFFAANPMATGVNLGCGLSNHFQWFDDGANSWLDADLPEVMRLRRSLMPRDSARHRQAEVDLIQPNWWRRLKLPSGVGQPPVFAVCEGVLMYFQSEQALAVLEEFARWAPPGSQLVLDVLSRTVIGCDGKHPRVGPKGAEFRWGVEKFEELLAVNPRLQLSQVRSSAEAYGWLAMSTEAFWSAWAGAPVYSVVTLGV